MELGNASMIQVISGETARELPLNGRDWTQLATLEAGDKTVPITLHSGRLLDARKANHKVHEIKIYDQSPGDHVFLLEIPTSAKISSIERSRFWPNISNR